MHRASVTLNIVQHDWNMGVVFGKCGCHRGDHGGHCMPTKDTDTKDRPPVVTEESRQD